MPKDISVTHQSKSYLCRKYDRSDEPDILESFFFWKTAVLLAEQTNSRKPQLPASFSEPFCCLVCDLVHKPGTGPDAFRLNGQNEAVARIEIKATVTNSGFTDIKRDLNFDELYWLSLGDFKSLQFKVFRLTSTNLTASVQKSNTLRERATIGLESIVQGAGLKPVVLGRIGIIRAKIG